MAGKGGFRFEIEGAKELEKALMELPKAMSKAVLRNAAKRALKPVAARASELAPVGPVDSKNPKKSHGHYKTSFIVNTQIKRGQRSGLKDRGAIEVYVGSTDPKAHLVEWGTQQRVQKTTGRKTGSSPPRPALRPAWDEKKQEVFEIFQREIWKELAKAAQRLAKKAIKGTLSKGQIDKLMRG